MRNLYKVRSFVVLAVMTILMASCLEDTGYLDIYNGVGKETAVVSIGQAETGVNVKAVDILPSIEIPVVINVARATQDMQVTLAIDPTLIDEYNRENAGSDFIPYIMLPDSTYTIPSLTVNVPAGTLDVPLVINVNSEKIDLTENYALPLVITSISGQEGAVIASNLNTSLVSIVVKNKWDGIYTIAAADATFVDNLNATFTESYPKTIHLITSGANTVDYFDPDLNSGTYGYLFETPDGGSYYGNFGPRFHFSGDKVTNVSNSQPPGANNRQGKLNVAGVNTVTYNADGTVNTIDVSYIMVHLGNDRVFITEKLKRTGPRP